MSHNAVVHIFLPVDLATALRLDPPCVYQRAPEGHRPLEADSLAAPLEMSDDNLGLRQSSAVIRDTSHISRKQFHLSLQDTVKAALHRAAEIKSKYSRLLPDIQTDLAAQINAIQSGYRPDQFDIAACCCSVAIVLLLLFVSSAFRFEFLPLSTEAECVLCETCYFLTLWINTGHLKA